jgi:hypothetical protein
LSGRNETPQREASIRAFRAGRANPGTPGGGRAKVRLPKKRPSHSQKQKRPTKNILASSTFFSGTASALSSSSNERALFIVARISPKSRNFNSQSICDVYWMEHLPLLCVGIASIHLGSLRVAHTAMAIILTISFGNTASAPASAMGVARRAAMR